MTPTGQEREAPREVWLSEMAVQNMLNHVSALAYGTQSDLDDTLYIRADLAAGLDPAALSPDAREHLKERADLAAPGDRERRLAKAVLKRICCSGTEAGMVHSVGCDGEAADAEARAVLASPEADPPARRVPSVREVMSKHGIKLPADSGEVDRLCRPASWETDEPPVPASLGLPVRESKP